MEQKLIELDKALESLVLPKLADGKEIVAIRQYIGIYSLHQQKILTIQITDKQEWEDVKKARLEDINGDHWVEEFVYAGIKVGNGYDWYIQGNRHNYPTILAATQLVDIVVEKVLGCSCGYEMNSLVK